MCLCVSDAVYEIDRQQLDFISTLDVLLPGRQTQH